jgi:hypothetical protein
LENIFNTSSKSDIYTNPSLRELPDLFNALAKEIPFYFNAMSSAAKIAWLIFRKKNTVV